MDNDGSPAFDAAATLDVWRARGQHRVDPVRFRFLEAMARRAAGHGGAARQLLDRRLAALIEAYGRAIEDRAAAQSAAPGAGAQDGRSEGLAALLAHIARHAPAAAAQPAAGTTLRAAPAAELKAVRLFKSTWSRLSADRRLTQSLAKVPENAGPLNSHHLVHRALVLMHELSPEYLNRFMSHVDALLWLEQMQGGGGTTPAAPNPPRAEGAQKKRAKS